MKRTHLARLTTLCVLLWNGCAVDPDAPDVGVERQPLATQPVAGSPGIVIVPNAEKEFTKTTEEASAEAAAAAELMSEKHCSAGGKTFYGRVYYTASGSNVSLKRAYYKMYPADASSDENNITLQTVTTRIWWTDNGKRDATFRLLGSGSKTYARTTGFYWKAVFDVPGNDPHCAINNFRL
jgi:hypothetical protein